MLRQGRLVNLKPFACFHKQDREFINVVFDVKNFSRKNAKQEFVFLVLSEKFDALHQLWTLHLLDCAGCVRRICNRTPSFIRNYDEVLSYCNLQNVYHIRWETAFEVIQ